MLVLNSPSLEGWKAEWTLVGKKVPKYLTLDQAGGSNRGPHCAAPPPHCPRVEHFGLPQGLSYLAFEKPSSYKQFNGSDRSKKIPLVYNYNKRG